MLLATGVAQEARATIPRILVVTTVRTALGNAVEAPAIGLAGAGLRTASAARGKALVAVLGVAVVVFASSLPARRTARAEIRP